MTCYEIEQSLNSLYKDLEVAENSDEQTACKVFNADSKTEILQIIHAEIEFYEAMLYSDDGEDDGMDYQSLQRVQGMAITNW